MIVCVCVCDVLKTSGHLPPARARAVLPLLLSVSVSCGAQELVAACEKVAKDDWGYAEMFLYVKKQNTGGLSRSRGSG